MRQAHSAGGKGRITAYNVSPCLHLGRQATYRGETARSGRQHGGEHARDLKNGLVSSPLVLHCIEEHGGITPRFIHTITQIEPKPLYRAVRESVQIGGQPFGPNNLNRCQEWGAPRVPILSVAGGDEVWGPVPGKENPRPTWTAETMEMVRSGTLKRVRLQPEDWRHEEEGDLSNSTTSPAPAPAPSTAPGGDVWGSGGTCPPTYAGLAPPPRCSSPPPPIHYNSPER